MGMLLQHGVTQRILLHEPVWGHASGVYVTVCGVLDDVEHNTVGAKVAGFVPAL